MQMVKVRRDLTDKIFGRWKVICQVEDYISPKGIHSPQWLCECSCDEHNRKIVSQGSLIRGLSESCGCIKRGDNRVGEERLNNQGCPMKIVEHNSFNNILIEFQDEYKYRKHTDIAKFEKGNVANPYDKTVLNIGYIGVGKYSKENDVECYTCWRNMLARCFDEEYKEKYPTYIDACIVDEWLNFQTFANWYYDNIYYIPSERMEIDKDILFKGNKLYSPDRCVFVPRRINSLLINNKSIRGEYPVGVDLHDGRFRARCNTLNGSVFIGYYDTPLLAFAAYKKFKESYIKQVADEYKNRIPEILYNALYNFEIEVDD